ITMAKGTNCELADEISKSGFKIQNMCCYTCQGEVCCCNFNPPAQICSSLGCIGA
ncbi:hypothetical protein V2W45_1218405, partial [Cenococcum geophilum]